MGHCATITTRVLKEAGAGYGLPHASAWYCPSSLYNALNVSLSARLNDHERSNFFVRHGRERVSRKPTAGGEGRGSRIVSVVRGVPRFRRAGAKKRRRGVRWVRAPWREATGCARGRAGVFARVRVVARDADAPRASRERVVLARAFPSARSASSTSTDSSRASAAAATSPAAAALEIRQGHASRRHSRAADEAARRDAGASDDSGRG